MDGLCCLVGLLVFMLHAADVCRVCVWPFIMFAVVIFAGCLCLCVLLGRVLVVRRACSLLSSA
jgi:hypothetical protein